MPTLKHALVLWSGGLDSTALIQYYLGNNYKVTALPVALVGNVNKTIREAAAREELAKHFQRWNTDQNRFELLQTSRVEMVSFGNLIGLSQAPIWLAALACRVERHHDEVAIGYVMNDDAASFSENIQAIWQSYGALTSDSPLHMVDRHPWPPLVFPILRVSKRRLWDNLGHEITDKVTWCEGEAGPQDKCGECVPCKKMIYFGLQPPKMSKSATESTEPEQSSDLKDKKE